MKQNERLRDILLSCKDHFLPEEITFLGTNKTLTAFKSWEYNMILHLTNEELYYLPQEQFENFEDTCDLQLETEYGMIYCFK